MKEVMINFIQTKSIHTTAYFICLVVFQISPSFSQGDFRHYPSSGNDDGYHIVSYQDAEKPKPKYTAEDLFYTLSQRLASRNSEQGHSPDRRSISYQNSRENTGYEPSFSNQNGYSPPSGNSRERYVDYDDNNYGPSNYHPDERNSRERYDRSGIDQEFAKIQKSSGFRRNPYSGERHGEGGDSYEDFPQSGQKSSGYDGEGFYPRKSSNRDYTDGYGDRTDAEVGYRATSPSLAQQRVLNFGNHGPKSTRHNNIGSAARRIQPTRGGYGSYGPSRGGGGGYYNPPPHHFVGNNKAGPDVVAYRGDSPRVQPVRPHGPTLNEQPSLGNILNKAIIIGDYDSKTKKLASGDISEYLYNEYLVFRK